LKTLPFGLPQRLRLKHNRIQKIKPAKRAIPAMPPMTIPAIAPPESRLDALAGMAVCEDFGD